MNNTLDIQNIWKKYKTGKYPHLKNKIVLHYYYLVKRIANKLASKMNYKVSPDELGSHGIDGLYKAIKAYDLERGIKFETYAYARIHGSMIDGLRTEDWVPRSVRIRHNQIEKAREEARLDLGHEPREEEVIQRAGIDFNEFSSQRKKYNPTSFASIDSNFISHSSTEESENKQDFNKYLEDSNGEEPGFDMERREFLIKAIGKDLKMVEKKIIYYYYYQKLTMREISNIINMSESRVSQIHHAVLGKIRQSIHQNPELFGEDVLRFFGQKEN